MHIAFTEIYSVVRKEKMIKYVVINKITKEEVSNDLADALEARAFIYHL